MFYLTAYKSEFYVALTLFGVHEESRYLCYRKLKK